jgi:hydroxyethylthiazole kinase
MTLKETFTHTTWPDASIVEDLTRLRQKNPLVHCVTNLVVTSFTANVLLAVGASPAMVVAVEEVGQFAPVADALLVNVGTVTAIDAGAMLEAARAANQAGTPWVLDPVAVGALSFRTDVVQQLLGHHPTIIRGNASEILALAGEGSKSKGADSTADSSEALDGARSLATRTGAVVAVTGVVDYVTDGNEVVGVPGSHELLTKVTGSGCALGAVLAAFVGVQDSVFRAAVSGSAVFAIAGERAAHDARGPGSLAVALVDHLYLVGREGDEAPVSST